MLNVRNFSNQFELCSFINTNKIEQAQIVSIICDTTLFYPYMVFYWEVEK